MVPYVKSQSPFSTPQTVLRLRDSDLKDELGHPVKPNQVYIIMIFPVLPQGLMAIYSSNCTMGKKKYPGISKTARYMD